MKDNVSRLFQLLIAAGWSKNRILDTLDDIRDSDNIGLYEELNIAIKLMRNIDSSIERSKYYEHDINKDRIELSRNINTRKPLETNIPKPYHLTEYDEENSETIAKIYSMLINDAGLTASDIVEEFTTRLSRIKDSPIPALSKKSLANWLNRVMNYYTKSEILHVATSIMNDYTKNKKMEWSVRNERKS